MTPKGKKKFLLSEICPRQTSIYSYVKCRAMDFLLCLCMYWVLVRMVKMAAGGQTS